MTTPPVLIPVVGITASEGAMFFGATEAALWGHFLTLFVTLMLPLRYAEDLPLVRAFALVPLFRLVNLGMPVFFELTVYWLPLIYGPLLPGLYLILRSQPPVEPTLIEDRLQIALLLPVGLAYSALLAHAEYAIIEPESLIPTWSILHVLLISIVMLGFVGFVEELLFRGILQRTIEAKFGKWTGLLVASGIFGLMHSGYGLLTEVGFAALIGLSFGLIYRWTNSLALITVIHGMLNVFLFAVIPMQGSLLSL